MDDESLMTHLIARLFDDYTQALVHVLWAVRPDPLTGKVTRRLLFGLVEAFPRELTLLQETREQAVCFNRNQRLFYIRKRMKVQDALELYTGALETSSLAMRWEANQPDGAIKTIDAGQLVGATRWPYLLLADHARLPAVAPGWGMARVHSLLPVETDQLSSIWGYAGPMEWIQERLLFDLYAQDALLLGSLHLVLPNPLYRRMHQRLVPGMGGEVDHVRIGFVLREGLEGSIADQLFLVHWEDRQTGTALQVLNPIGANPVELALTGIAEKTSPFVFCRERGLLDWRAPAGFVRRVQVTGRVLECVQKLHLRDLSVVANSSELTTDRYSTFSAHELGATEADQTPERELGERLTRLRQGQRMRDDAKRYEQYYCQDEKQAQEYVRKLIQRAKRQLTIIDPYFDDRALMAFAAQTRIENLPVRILTWADTLKKTAATQRDGELVTGESVCFNSSLVEGAESVRVWQRMHEELGWLNAQLRHAISIDVMTGNNAVFHDRFLIVDDEVWFSGNSLNTIGRRQGMILKLPDPQQVLEALAALDRERQRLKPFDDWIREWKANTGGL